MHKRQQIRDAIVTLLKDAGTSFGDSIHTNRGRHIYPNEFPYALVYIEQETSNPLLYPTEKLERSIKLIVEFACFMVDNIDDEIDSFSKEIEDVLTVQIQPNSKYSNLFQSLNLEQTEIGVLEDGEKIMGSARLTFSVVYES